MFFVGTSGGAAGGLLAALLLTGVILLGVLLTFWMSRLLSATVLPASAVSSPLRVTCSQGMVRMVRVSPGWT